MMMEGDDENMESNITHNKMMSQLGRRATSLWKNEVNLILNKHLIKGLYLFMKLLLL